MQDNFFSELKQTVLKDVFSDPIDSILSYIFSPFKMLFYYVYLTINFIIDMFLEFLSIFTDIIPYSEYVMFQAFVLILILFVIVIIIVTEHRNNSLTKPIAYQNCASVISKFAMVNVALLCFPDLHRKRFENGDMTVFSAIFSLCTVIFLLLDVMFFTFTSNNINHYADREIVSLAFLFTSLYALLSGSYPKYFCIIFMISNAVYGYMMTNYFKRNGVY